MILKTRHHGTRVPYFFFFFFLPFISFCRPGLLHMLWRHTTTKVLPREGLRRQVGMCTAAGAACDRISKHARQEEDEAIVIGRRYERRRHAGG